MIWKNPIMLTIPTKGFQRSVQKHNVQLDIMCDWIEGSVLFSDERLSISDIADFLIENAIYDDQDFAREMVQNAWAELQKRSRLIGSGCAFFIDINWIRPVSIWQEFPAHTFCVVLALAAYYDWWISEFGADYNEQGDRSSPCS